MAFRPDPQQAAVIEHARGALLVTGGPGTGKTATLRERIARLIEQGADPERVALVVRTRRDRREAKDELLARLRRSLPGLQVMTVHALAHAVLGRRFRELGFDHQPDILPAVDQFARVRRMLAGEDPLDWPTFGPILGMRGFADEVRQFLLRAQEALLAPADVAARAQEQGLASWSEVARFYGRYAEDLRRNGEVDFAGLVAHAAYGARLGEPPFDHVVVDDYQESTPASERLLLDLGAQTLVAAGDANAHVFWFQGTTDLPLRRFLQRLPGAGEVRLGTNHRGPAVTHDAWYAPHTSDEHAAVARELLRVHVRDGVPWGNLAVIVRRQDDRVGGLLRALDDAGIPRSTPERGLSLLAEPATHPFILALRWLARPNERDALVEPLLTSPLAHLSPAAARGLVRVAQAAGDAAAEALDHSQGLAPGEVEAVEALGKALHRAGEVAERSVLDAFAVLWRSLPYANGLVRGAGTAAGDRDLRAVGLFSRAVAEAEERSDASVAAFLDVVEAGREGPGFGDPVQDAAGDAVWILTAHGAAGREFDTALVVGSVEGNFPSLARPEPMFDLATLEGPIPQSDRNRARLQDERRLFRMVAARARRRVVFTASEPAGGASDVTVRSRFVAERGIQWRPTPRSGLAPPWPPDQPLAPGEAAGTWRRILADRSMGHAVRLAALDGLLALGIDPDRWWFQREWTGTGEPLHEGVRVSYSKLETLENCPLQFVLSEELGLEGEPGYHAWTGHLVHRLIEDVEAGEIPRNLDALLAEADRRWRPQRFPSRSVSHAFRQLVVGSMLPAWFAEFGDSPALGREIRFEFAFADATVTGYIDRIGPVQKGGSQIVDYKTGRSRNAGKAEDNLQLGIYYLAVNHAEELEAFRPVKAVELVFLRDRDRFTGEIMRVPLGLTSKVEPAYREAMTNRLAGLIGQLGEIQAKEVYRPRPAANCRYCDFKALCSLWPEGKELFSARASAGSEPPPAAGLPAVAEVRAGT